MTRRAASVGSGCLVFGLSALAYKQGWWPTLLDWAVVAIPAVAGLVAWVIPIKQTTTSNRAWLFIGGLLLSGLIYLQQWATRAAHAKEVAGLATKEDIAKLPTAVDFAREYAKLQEHPAHESAPPQKRQFPDVAMRFVSPQEPLLLLENESAAIAREIKWVVALWNTDLPERDDPLPIPISIFDWLKPHAVSGPQSLFGSQLVKPLVKPGDHLLGSATAICPECSRGHTYIVSITFGTGGWYAEDKEDYSGKLLVPSNFHKETRERFLAQLPAIVPEKSRIPIGEYKMPPAKPSF